MDVALFQAGHLGVGGVVADDRTALEEVETHSMTLLLDLDRSLGLGSGSGWRSSLVLVGACHKGRYLTCWVRVSVSW